MDITRLYVDRKHPRVFHASVLSTQLERMLHNVSTVIEGDTTPGSCQFCDVYGHFKASRGLTPSLVVWWLGSLMKPSLYFSPGPHQLYLKAIVPLNEAKGWSRTYLSKPQAGSCHALTNGLNTIHIQSPGEGASVYVFWKVFANIFQEFKNCICLVTQQFYFLASSLKQGAL